MPARVEEVAHAQEKGVIFHLLQNAKSIRGDKNGRVTGMECLRYELANLTVRGGAVQLKSKAASS